MSDLVMPERVKPLAQFYEVDEIKRLIAAAGEPLKTILIVLVLTGLRINEARKYSCSSPRSRTVATNGSAITVSETRNKDATNRGERLRARGAAHSCGERQRANYGLARPGQRIDYLLYEEAVSKIKKNERDRPNSLAASKFCTCHGILLWDLALSAFIQTIHDIPNVP